MTREKGQGTGESESSQRRIAAVERQRQALELRKAGAGYVAIAQKVGYKGPSGAYNAIRSALKRTIQEPADELRKLEVERLDRMLLAIWDQVRNGNQGAIDRALRIGERRARLLGLDAPTKQDITSAGKPVGMALPVSTEEVQQYQQALEEGFKVLARRAEEHLTPSPSPETEGEGRKPDEGEPEGGENG